jgi:hypothetical protein
LLCLISYPSISGEATQENVIMTRERIKVRDTVVHMLDPERRGVVLHVDDQLQVKVRTPTADEILPMGCWQKLSDDLNK